ncbi:MAG TPA: ZIP family metal transporter [Candidatus Eisenbacteria bacterium]|nr:ZIP family metal transporter [Candidatus Eisenbacteria bacterium]
MSDFSSLIHSQPMTTRVLPAIAAAALGALVASLIDRVSHRALCLLISFAAGALLSVAVFDMMPEAAQMAGWTAAAGGAMAGYFLFFLISRFIFHVCPACSATHTEANFKALTWTMMIALSIHSFMDGFAVCAGGADASRVGLLVLVAVVYHKLPEGLALTLVAIASGFGRPKAFLVTVALEAVTTLAGGLVAMNVSLTPFWTGAAIGLAAGSFVYVVIHALLSEFIKHHPRSTVLAALAGAAAMILTGFFLAQPGRV